MTIDFFCIQHRFLVSNLVTRNLKVKYRRSFAGILWTLLAPLSLAALYYFVFSVILKVSQPHYLAFILSGVLPWSFVAQSLTEGVDSLVSNWALISKVPVPTQVFPFVGTLTNFINLMIAIPVALAASVLSGVELGPSVIVLIPLLIALFITVYGLSMIMGMIYVYLRDLKNAVGILIQFWFYATPVIYSEALIPERFQWIVYANPFGCFFTSFHSILVAGAWPTLSHLFGVAIWTCVMGLGGAMVYGSQQYQVVEQI